MKRRCIVLFLVAINCFSFAQKKKIISLYRASFQAIIFYNDSTFLYRVNSHCGVIQPDNDTINYGTYIKEKKYYIITSALVKDSIEIVPIINKNKIILNGQLFLEWKYSRKKEKQTSEKITRWRDYRHMMKHGTSFHPRWQRLPKKYRVAKTN